ncbi:hypothetical protein [Elizabethkingia meningoseptica]|uniref:hypothetical protein n=1 Tax=Elizabethkingia meningoseptica TaxID=238 RepID=UPI0008419848|nr:hypothetical protein [Elizabethkingia meningoseptica]ODM55200.1 hypothetical protein BES09_01730 [Elizabethkingia meningoseptica]OHT30405.1 hypothetical protein BFF93_01735 [Elizabethkingia meningoseptica]OPC12141.1 hypothetical protein BAX93_06520 [Elizabethkingia meningoseptica]
MTLNSFTVLRPLENFFDKQNLEDIVSKFVINNFGDGYVLFIEHDLYKDGTNYSLQDLYLDQFSPIYTVVLGSISTELASISTTLKNKLIRYIEITLKFILNENQKFLKDNPKIKLEILNIKKYILQKHSIRLYLGEKPLNSDSLFKPKNRSQIKKLYTLSTKYQIIDEELVSEEMFLNALYNDSYLETIQFSCKTAVMVNYLQTIAPLFKVFDVNTIVKSRKFLTKGKKSPISRNLFDKTKSINKNNIQKDESLIEICQYVDSLMYSG